jgi:hypothetical protein
MLREQLHVLYNIVCHKGDFIAMFMASSPLSVALRRDLIRHRLVAWNALFQPLASVQLTSGNDEF